MIAKVFDLGLSEEDLRTMQAGRRTAAPLDREAALRFIEGVALLVDAEVRRRPLLRGKPFTLPGCDEAPLP